MEDNELEPFICDGISLGIPNKDATDISDLDNVFFLDDKGELHFRDEFIRSLGLDSVTLRDLSERMRGVSFKDGKLFFKDSTIDKPVSLQELIGAYVNWQNRLTNGGVYWIGRTVITGAEFDNIKVNVNGDPTSGANTEEGRLFTKDTEGNYQSFSEGTEVFSIDQFLLENDSGGEFDDGDFKTLSNGQWRWHDIPGLEIEIPPVDKNKSAMIVSKLLVRLIESKEPIVFRLIDVTTNQELDRVAISNDSKNSYEQSVTLTHYGPLEMRTEALQQINCECPNGIQRNNIEIEPPHVLKVQFFVNSILTDDVTTELQSSSVVDDECVLETTNVVKFAGLERRLIGIPNSLSDEPLVNSNINVTLFNIDKSDDVGRKTGSESLSNTNRVQVTFNRPFTDSTYSISLSPNKNINTWYEAKKSTGFIIMTEKKMTGTVDWTAVKLKFEGDA